MLATISQRFVPQSLSPASDILMQTQSIRLGHHYAEVVGNLLRHGKGLLEDSYVELLLGTITALPVARERAMAVGESCGNGFIVTDTLPNIGGPFRVLVSHTHPEPYCKYRHRS